MADKTLIATGAAIDLSAGASYSPAGVPVAGDRLFLTVGATTDKITAGLTALSAGTLGGNLAGVWVYDTWLGQGGTDALSGGDIQIGYDVMHFGIPAGTRATSAGGSPKFKVSATTAASITIVYGTGAATDAASGGEAFRWTGTHATANKFYMLGGSAGIATVDLTAAVVQDIDVQGGLLNIGRNATPRNVLMTGGGTLRHAGLLHASGYIKQLNVAAKLYTSGASLLPTVHVMGSAWLNHRAAAGASVTDLLIRGGGTCDLTDDPRGIEITNAIAVQKGGRLYFASPTQLTGTWKTDGCDLNEVTVKAGAPVAVTMAAA
jgi:hypothetical protein